jgi:hypothetical protein
MHYAVFITATKSFIVQAHGHCLLTRSVDEGPILQIF